MAFHGGWRIFVSIAAMLPIGLFAQQDSITLAGQTCDTTLSAPPTGLQVPGKDTTSFISSSLYGSLSASYASSSNWNGQDQRNFALVGNLLYSHNLFATTHSHSHMVMADLGFLKFVDSTWEKSLDRLQVNLLWNNSGRKFNSSYSVAFGTQFLPANYPEYDPEQDKLLNRSVGGFLNPFNLQLGYGGVFRFWDRSSINFAFATLQFSSSPKEFTSSAFLDANVIEGKRAFYF